MHLFTISSSWFFDLTENFVVSARRFGIDVTAYVPSKEHATDRFKCEILSDPQYTKEKCAGLGAKGFNSICNFKLSVISHLIARGGRFPLFYVDGDAAIIRDPRPWMEKCLRHSIAIQKQSPIVKHPDWDGYYPYCLGMVYIQGDSAWTRRIFKTPKDTKFDDEITVNRRIASESTLIQRQITCLPPEKFVIGCDNPGPETLIYHANYCVGAEVKKAKLQKKGMWFLDQKR